MDVGANIQCLVFPWFLVENTSTWDNYKMQNHRKDWCYDDYISCRLITPHNKLLPFQIKRNYLQYSTVNDLTWIAVNLLTGAEIDLINLLPSGQTTLKIRTTGEEDWIIYYATQSFTSYLEGGYYYCRLDDGTNYFYSEVFWVDCFIDPLDYVGNIITIDDEGEVGLVIERHPTWEDFLLAENGDVVLP